jgi:hypothetical protein
MPQAVVPDQGHASLEIYLGNALSSFFVLAQDRIAWLVIVANAIQSNDDHVGFFNVGALLHIGQGFRVDTVAMKWQIDVAMGGAGGVVVGIGKRTPPFESLATYPD